MFNQYPERVQCTRYVNGAAPCETLYSQVSCNTVAKSKSCQSTKTVSFPVEVKYKADGGIIGSNSEASVIWGFKMNYEFVECPSGEMIYFSYLGLHLKLITRHRN